MATELVARLRRQIQNNGGWLAFDAFMAEALYAPLYGYYSRERPPFGTMPEDGSDFVTAPEMSALFARALARQVSQALSCTQTQTVFEFGAGSGALADQLLTRLDGEHQGPPVGYCILELSAALRQTQMQRLARFGPRVQWLEALPEEIRGVVLGNEVLDAMPVKLLHFDGAQWLERGVCVGSAPGTGGEAPFCWADRPTPCAPPLTRADWVPSTVTEIHPHAQAWIASVGARLRQGAMFLIDYGFPEAEYYHPQRTGGTLMCHARHRADTNPLVDVGHKDITAHVNFTAMALAGQDAGLEVLGYTSQGRFLLNCGIAADLDGASLKERVMAQRLIAEHEMGELFKVLAFASPQQPFEAMGFAVGDRTHRL